MRITFVIFILLVSCKHNHKQSKRLTTTTKPVVVDTIVTNTLTTIDGDSTNYYEGLLNHNKEYIATGFDFPVDKPDAKGYYNAQEFQENNHLGDDWNGVKGGNSDLGDPIYAIANGYVKEAKDYEGGWGNVIRIVHFYNGQLYESLYAHCDKIITLKGKFVKKGEQIGTIGNLNGYYYAHLHFEIRNDITLDIGGGYDSDTTGYLDPTEFIKKNR